MYSEFSSSTTNSTEYSIYTDYIPTNIEGNTSVYSSSDTSANRTAVPYTMAKDGILHSVSIYHNGGSLFLWHGHLAHAFMGWKPMTRNSRKFELRLADYRA